MDQQVFYRYYQDGDSIHFTWETFSRVIASNGLPYISITIPAFTIANPIEHIIQVEYNERIQKGLVSFIPLLHLNSTEVRWYFLYSKRGHEVEINDQVTIYGSSVDINVKM